jgi:hypothetical protein
MCAVLITEDASNDARFSHNPYVAGSPYVKFYAGAPLVGTGTMPHLQPLLLLPLSLPLLLLLLLLPLLLILPPLWLLLLLLHLSDNRGGAFVLTFSLSSLSSCCFASGGRRYGTLCVCDVQSRAFTAEMYHLLINFAELAVQELERDSVRAGNHRFSTFMLTDLELDSHPSPHDDGHGDDVGYC